jgi:hypothetical protein
MSKNTKAKYTTREEWLNAAVQLAAAFFKTKGHEVPPVRVSCGWPSSRGLSRKKPAWGECWAAEAATDKLHQIFITPREKSATGPSGVLGVLVHELVHATVGLKAKHGTVFKKCALSVGLIGKMTATGPGPELAEVTEGWVKELGDYPHAALNPMQRPTKKQTTRMVKCECGACGYSCRTTRKWLDQTGPPLCACNKKPMEFEIPEELEGGDE